MQSTSCTIPGWMKQKLDSRLTGDISVTSDMQMTPPLWQKAKRTKEPLDEGERGEWKSWLKAQRSENEDHGIQSHHFMVNRWGNSGNKMYIHLKVLVTQSCLTVCDPGDCSPPGSSVHGIFQAKILEWVAIFFSRKSTIWLSNSTNGHIPWENHNSKRYMYSNVHCSTIYNSQDIEAT